MKFLAFASQRQSVSSFPVGAARTTSSLAESMSFANTSGGLGGRGQTTKFTMLVHWIANPLCLRIAADCLLKVNIRFTAVMDSIMNQI